MDWRLRSDHSEEGATEGWQGGRDVGSWRKPAVGEGTRVQRPSWNERGELGEQNEDQHGLGLGSRIWDVERQKAARSCRRRALQPTERKVDFI